MSRRRYLRRMNDRTRIGKFNNTIIRDPSLPRILVEGDSWYSYPLKKNLYAQVRGMVPGAYLCTAKVGDTVEKMLFGKQARKLKKYLKGWPFDVILFSGGGNDIVGEVLLEVLKEKKAGMGWEDCIDKAAFKRIQDRVEEGYRELLKFRDAHAPNCVVIAHGYDYPLPMNKGAKIFGIRVSGPWIHPHMKTRKITEQEDKNAIGKWLIDQFNQMLANLAQNERKFVHVATPGTIDADQWHNELHPNSGGFKKVGVKVAAALRTSLGQ